MATDLYVQDNTISVETVGIQGPTGYVITVNKLEDIPNVDATGLVDGSLLIYEVASGNWIAGNIIDGGSY